LLTLLGSGSFRVVFDIAGNKFRMICKYGFGENEVHLFICWIGAHAEYDKLCKEEKQYIILTFIKLLLMEALKYKVIASDKQYDKYAKYWRNWYFHHQKQKQAKMKLPYLQC